MKKFIALLLAILMTFSVATVAFAADETTAAPETETTAPSGEGETEGEFDLGEFQWILDLPLWTLKPMLKVAKIAIKFVKVYLKLSEVFGNIPDGVADKIEQIIKDTIAKTEQDSAEPETTTAAAIA